MLPLSSLLVTFPVASCVAPWWDKKGTDAFSMRARLAAADS
jgi:hypothetical protein